MTEQRFTPWTEEEDEAVRTGVANGMSLREIGDPIGRTRNMVVNRIRRLGIIRQAIANAVEQEAKQEAELASNPVRLIDVGANACHWPLWQETGTPDFLVCGAPGYPYCVKHRRAGSSAARPLASLTSLGG